MLFKTQYVILTCFHNALLYLPFQCGNMAREGLRTLVVAKKSLTEEHYQDFEVKKIEKTHYYDAVGYNNHIME